LLLESPPVFVEGGGDAIVSGAAESLILQVLLLLIVFAILFIFLFSQQKNDNIYNLILGLFQNYLIQICHLEQ
jgi:ABC-type enterochelin transport system permease subunit